MALEVIGSGLSRTGTLSLKLALNQLGFGPCFHMSEIVAHPDRAPLWVRAGRGEADWDAVFDGYRSTVDAPGCHFWRELAEHFPSAKVLHSVRDPESWFESTQATVFGPDSVFAKRAAEGLAFAAMIVARYGGKSVNDLQDRGFMLEFFKRHTEEVISGVPPERLLVFEAAQGWPPLCAFLGIPVPQTPFPRVNDREHQAAVQAQARNPDGTIDEQKLREAVRGVEHG